MMREASFFLTVNKEEPGEKKMEMAVCGTLYVYPDRFFGQGGRER